MATAFVFTHARRASESAAHESLRNSLLQRGKRSKSILREEAALRVRAGGQRSVRVKPNASAPELSKHAANDATAPTPRYMIHPLNRWKLAWDWAIILFVLYSAAMVPWSIAFTLHESCAPPGAVHDGCIPEAIKGLDLAVDICFWIDLVLCFRTGYLDDRKNVHMAPGEVARQYGRTWFVVDLLSTFPFEEVAKTMLASSQSNMMVFKLFKLPRLLRIGRLMKKLSVLAAADGFRIAKLTLAFLFLGHWLGCMWYFLGRWQMERDSLNAFTGRLTWLQAFPGRGKSYAHADVRTKYTASLYWALTTMTSVGYGDIVPLTNFERAFTCVVELLGAVSTALVFGNVALLVQGFEGAGARYRERLQTLREFCAFHALPPPLARRIRASVDYLWAAHAGLDAPIVLAELPPPLRAEVLSCVQQRVVQSASLFKHCHPGMVNAVVVRLRQQVVLPGDDVFSAGDAGGELFFIGRGRVEVTDGGQGRVLATLDAGEFFGEVEAFGTRTRRLATATARTFCDLFVIGKEELAEVLAEFPEYQHAIRAAAEQRIAELAARGAVLDEHPARRAPLDARAAVAEETAPAADDGAAAAAVPSPVSTLGDAERLVDELMRWQSAQATAMHRQLALLEEAQAGVALKLQALTQAHAHATAKQQRAASGGGAVPQALNALRSGAAALSRRLRVVHPRDPAPVQPSGGRV